ncbi:hypothetical protein HG530_014561 [Fusarium avenaceum]|nr:hypothetical protein HG530_014561 [Fusarium avenaceum]
MWCKLSYRAHDNFKPSGPLGLSASIAACRSSKDMFHICGNSFSAGHGGCDIAVHHCLGAMLFGFQTYLRQAPKTRAKNKTLASSQSLIPQAFWDRSGECHIDRLKSFDAVLWSLGNVADAPLGMLSRDAFLYRGDVKLPEEG